MSKDGRTQTHSHSMADEESQRLWEGDLFRLLVENVKDYAIFILDAEGKVLSWSKGAERVLGYGEAEIVSQHYHIFFTPEDREKGEPEREIQQAAQTGRGEDDRWHVRKDGKSFWCSGVMTPLRDEEGALRGFAKIMRDLTERKLAVEKLQETEGQLRKRTEELIQANKNKDEFLAMLSHELRNPLAPIHTAMHILQQGEPDETIRQHAQNMIERQVRHLTRLVDDLLEVSRLTQGKIELKKEHIELSNVISRAVETSRQLIEARKHHLTVSLPDEPIWLEADPVRLEQVLTNLLNNAVKYTNEKGQMRLTVRREANAAVISVRDNGVGIAPEMLSHIFELFAQLDRSLDRSQGGLGVGLNLAWRLVKMHGGSLNAVSEGVGKGSEFIVSLPVLSEPPTPKAAEGRATNLTAHSLRVLVVDDNNDAADSLRMLLQMVGHEVIVAHTGPTGIQQATRWRPEVILLDIGLPGLDGYQVAGHLRKQDDMKNVVIIAMTGYGQETDRQRSKETGFDYHLVKPVDPQKLQELLTVLATGRKSPTPQ